jgi:Arc/MetJ-type ribon-helix-helix transcriptional regulator
MNVPLPPDLENIIRDQLAAGRFQSEDEVMRAALRMLDERRSPTPARPNLSGEPGPPARLPVVRRSPRGMLADLLSHISPDEITEARTRMWTSLPHREA